MFLFLVFPFLKSIIFVSHFKMQRSVKSVKNAMNFLKFSKVASREPRANSQSSPVCPALWPHFSAPDL